MIKLTQSDGCDIWVRKESISAIYGTTTGYITGTNSVIVVGGSHQGLRETVDQVLAGLS